MGHSLLECKVISVAVSVESDGAKASSYEVLEVMVLPTMIKNRMSNDVEEERLCVPP